MQKILLVDLQAQYERYRDEFDRAIAGCVAHSHFIGGPDHRAFSDEFARFCGDGHVALCGNGTDAIYLALMELLGPGDGMSEIITVAHTFIATVEAVKQAGYRPVFVDIDPDTCLMDPGQIEAAITPRTRAIIPVHLYGQMTPMAAVMEIANRHGLVVIEDAAQAHGALWQGKGPGAWGHAATFSFYPGKNLGAWGDAGAVFTRDEALATRMRMRANHGRMSKYEHEIEGMNSRLDGIQAAILRAKLPHLSEWNAARRQAAGWYAQELKDVPGLKTPVCHAQAQHVYHLYVVQLEQQRDEVMRRMLEQGIEVGVHYPVPLHRQPALRYLGYDPRCFPITNRVAETILSLPLYPEITRQQVQTVAGALKSAMQGVD